MNAEEIIRDLQKPWRHGEHLNARDVTIEERFILDGLTLRGVDFSNAQFKSGISARGAIFSGLAWFTNVEINGNFDLTGAQFRIDFRGEGLRADRLLLDEVQILGVLALARTHIREISASNALIMANLTLEEAKISETLDLNHAEILGGYWAERAQLGNVQDETAEISGRQRR